MPKTKIEDLPRLEDLDPEDQRLIRGGSPKAGAPARTLRPRPVIQPPADEDADEGFIVSRLPPGA